MQVKTTRTLEVMPGRSSPQPTSPRRITEITDPRGVDWTPDGKLLVSDGEKITRMDADGQNASPLVGDPGAQLFGPSACGGQYLVFTWVYHAGNSIRIWRANADGSAPQPLTPGPFDLASSCSADGKWVYYIDTRGTGNVMRVPVEGGTPEHVPGSDIPGRFAMGRVSYFASDGKSIGFAVDLIDPRTNDAVVKFAIVSLEPGSPNRPRLLDLDPRFGTGNAGGDVQSVPGANAIAYPILEKGVSNIWVQFMNGSPGYQTTHFDSQQISDFSWSPDGKTLAVTREDSVADVVLLKEGNP